MGNSPDGGGGFFDDVDQARTRRRHPLVLALGALLLFGLGFGAFVLVAQLIDGDGVETAVAPAVPDESDESDESEATAGTGDPADGSESNGTGAEESDADGSTGQDPASGDPASGDPAGETVAAAPPEGAYVEATLDLDAGPGPGLFTLVGRVPDAETAELLVRSAELSYAPFVESDLEVDPTVGDAPWLSQAAAVIGLLPAVTDGTIRVVDGRVEVVAARTPLAGYADALEAALNQLGGMPVEMGEVTITDLAPPLFEVEVDEGQLELAGYVPSAEIKTLIEGGAVAAYGQSNVTSALTIDEGTYTSFWMYTMPGIFQLFAPFPSYSLKVEDGQTSGSLRGGVGFPTDSTEISADAAQVLEVGAAILARDPSLFMTVEGHTDATGPEGHNQTLSEARATSVVDHLVAAGIDPARMLAIGAGESDPLAPNDTPEGRALNRRVEFQFGPPPGT